MDQLSWDSEPGAGRGESYLSCLTLVKYRYNTDTDTDTDTDNFKYR